MGELLGDLVSFALVLLCQGAVLSLPFYVVPDLCVVSLRGPLYCDGVSTLCGFCASCVYGAEVEDLSSHSCWPFFGDCCYLFGLALVAFVEMEMALFPQVAVFWKRLGSNSLPCLRIALCLLANSSRHHLHLFRQEGKWLPPCPMPASLGCRPYLCGLRVTVCWLH